MKYLAVPLLLLLSSCKGLGAALMGGEEPSVDAQAHEIGTAAGDAAGLITGNPLVDMGVTALVAAGAGFFLRLKKKQTKKTADAV